MKFIYSDALGRLTTKQVYNGASNLVGLVSYYYDTSDDVNYTVFKGQLYKVVELEPYKPTNAKRVPKILIRRWNRLLGYEQNKSSPTSN